MSYAIDFTASLIKSHQSRLTESAKCSMKEEDKKVILKEEDEVLDTQDDGVEEETQTLIDDSEGFEESVQDTVHFCQTCNKHFLATPDTPPDEIVCPICGDVENLVDMGSAEDVLESEMEIEPDEIPEDTEDVDTESELVDEDSFEDDDSFEFDEDSLEEGLKILAKKHISEKCALRLRSCAIKNNNLVIEGRLVPQRKTFTVVFEGFEKESKGNKNSFILEGKTDLFKAGKLKGMFIREGKTFSVKKCGYGLIKESAGKSLKVKGILG